MMKPGSLCIVLGLFIIFSIIAAGCVAPPKASNSQSNTYYTGSGAGANATPTYSNLVTEATPFVTTTPGAQASVAFVSATATPVPEDQSCLIYSNTLHEYNTTAVSFNLKNPPMYITYSVIPFNITVNKVFDSRSGGGETQTLTYSDYAPYSWFEVTVRNRTSGEIYLDDGFGKAKGYGVYTNATFKILNTDDLLVELHANNITATTNIWVKPIGNVDDPQNQTFAQCKYWTGAPQNFLPMPTQTTVPTWTPENQISQLGPAPT